MDSTPLLEIMVIHFPNALEKIGLQKQSKETNTTQGVQTLTKSSLDVNLQTFTNGK